MSKGALRRLLCDGDAQVLEEAFKSALLAPSHKLSIRSLDLITLSPGAHLSLSWAIALSKPYRSPEPSP